ncbi:MAG TPA: lipoyl synthase [Clostridia bacterium]|nr:lipoyl synthase [Clostridia bacterium]
MSHKTREDSSKADFSRPHLPPWLKKTISAENKASEVDAILRPLGIHTVCEEALCPNIWECWGKKTATFMILGDTCTRRCSFCGVKKGIPSLPDPREAERVAEAAARLGLKFVVVTSVTRDDLPDGGAKIFADTISAIRDRIPECGVEVLVPDFRGDREALKTVVGAKPDVLNHNVETIKRLYPSVRPGARYERTLTLLKSVKEIDPDIVTKSGFMVGLGECDEEVYGLLKDLKDSGCDIVTIGQYLRPSFRHHAVMRYVEPEVFKQYEKWGRDLGLRKVVAGPLVRSSYLAESYAFAHTNGQPATLIRPCGKSTCSC